MTRLGIALASALVAPVACSQPSTGNKTHDLLIGLPEAGRADALSQLIGAAGKSCGTATRTFYQGMRPSKVATWSVACSNGTNYSVNIEPNDSGTTNVRDCELEKIATKVECFVKF